MTLPIAFAVAYLLGAIPTSYIITYLVTGRDIRSLGSGNPGTMNVWDNVGAVPAVIVGLGDVGKGMAAVGVAYWLGAGDVVAVSCGLLAVLGHDYSLFLRFHGGNGTAAAVGALLALVPEATIPAVGIAAVITIALHSKRIGGLVGLVLVPVLAAWQNYPDIRVVGVVILLTVVALKIVRFEGFSPARTRPPR